MFMRVLTASVLTIVLMTPALAGGAGGSHGGGGGGHGPGGGGHGPGAGSHSANGGDHGSHGIGSRGGDHGEGAGGDPGYNVYYGGQNYMGYGWGGPCTPYQNC
jgi:hypothetical protein